MATSVRNVSASTEIVNSECADVTQVLKVYIVIILQRKIAFYPEQSRHENKTIFMVVSTLDEWYVKYLEIPSVFTFTH